MKVLDQMQSEISFRRKVSRMANILGIRFYEACKYIEKRPFGTWKV